MRVLLQEHCCAARCLAGGTLAHPVDVVTSLLVPAGRRDASTREGHCTRPLQPDAGDFPASLRRSIAAELYRAAACEQSVRLRTVDV